MYWVNIVTLKVKVGFLTKQQLIFFSRVGLIDYPSVMLSFVAQKDSVYFGITLTTHSWIT